MNLVRVLPRSIGVGGIVLTLSLLAGCSSGSYHPDLPAYLKAEKEMRLRVKLEVHIRDSLVVLQNTFGIDPGVELAKCTTHPESWIDLIEELRREQ